MKKVMSVSQLQKKLSKKKKKVEGYKEGDENDKVWINFQSTKKLKREFREACLSSSTNGSELIRKFITLFIEKPELVEEFLGKNFK